MKLSLLSITAMCLLLPAGCKREAAKDGGRPSSQSDNGQAMQHVQEPVKRMHFTAEDNPTTRAGRGAPDLQDQTRPAAWVFVDEQEGKFLEEDGVPQLHWTIEQPVSVQPTFRVEVYEELVGVPTEARFVLQKRTEPPEEPLLYSFACEQGTFQVGRVYSVGSLGDGWRVVFMPQTERQEVVTSIPPLPPGDYILAAAVGAQKSDKEALAVTAFTIREATAAKP